MRFAPSVFLGAVCLLMLSNGLGCTGEDVEPPDDAAGAAGSGGTPGSGGASGPGSA